MSKESADRYSGRYQHWDMVELGWKYNISDILTALMLNQIDCLAARWRRRRDLYGKYCRKLDSIERLSRPSVVGKSAHHLNTVWIPGKDRDHVLTLLGEAGIGVAVNYRAIHTLTWFRNFLGHKHQEFPNALEIGNRTISLPFYPSLHEKKIDYVCNCLEKALHCVP